MENKIKKRALISMLIGIFGQVAALMFLTKIYPLLNWRLIAGIAVLIMGILILFNFFPIKRTVFKGKKLLFYSIIINPGIVSICSGIVLITMQDQRLKYISIFAGTATVLGIIIGFGMFIVFLMQRDKGESNK